MRGEGYSFSMLQMLNMLHVTLMKISDFGVSFGRFRGSCILPHFAAKTPNFVLF